MKTIKGAQQEAQKPVFCSYCGGNDESPQAHCTDCQRPIPTKDRIREIFIAHGFSIKEGQADLKQYVYDAAYALLSEAPQPAPAPPASKEQARSKQGASKEQDMTEPTDAEIIAHGITQKEGRS